MGWVFKVSLDYQHMLGIVWTVTKLILGVLREFQMDELLPEQQRWIRDIGQIENKPEYFYVICLNHSQAVAFQKMQSIQMDLWFKMVAGKVNTFTIVGWNKEAMSTNWVVTLHMLS